MVWRMPTLDSTLRKQVIVSMPPWLAAFLSCRCRTLVNSQYKRHLGRDVGKSPRREGTKQTPNYSRKFGRFQGQIRDAKVCDLRPCIRTHRQVSLSPRQRNPSLLPRDIDRGFRSPLNHYPVPQLDFAIQWF
jgi:hypothetical protein